VISIGTVALLSMRADAARRREIVRDGSRWVEAMAGSGREARAGVGWVFKEVTDMQAARPNPMTLINEFKAFLLRGNVVDLAVAVVVGAAFKSIVDALVADLITPFIAAIGGKQDFSALQFTIRSSTFRYGDLINQVISFVVISAVVFFFIVTPVNSLMARAKKEPPIDPTSKKCPECLSEIPLDARRCAFCTSALAA